MKTSISRTAPLRRLDLSGRKPINRLKSAFPRDFERVSLRQEKECNKLLEIMKAAFSSDQLAGSPFCDYLQSLEDDASWKKLRFWTSAYQLLINMADLDTSAKQRQIQALINVYLGETSALQVPIETEARDALITLLNRDLGVSLLIDVCDSIALDLVIDWKEYLTNDEEQFLKAVAVARGECPELEGCMLFFEGMYERNRKKDLMQGEIDLLNENLDTGDMFEAFKASRMWRALELAFFICLPKKYVSYSSDDDSDYESFEGSLTGARLRVLNRQAQRALEQYKSFTPSPPVMTHFYHRESLTTRHLDFGEVIKQEKILPVVKEVVETKRIHFKKAAPKPRVFQDILTDQEILDGFKKFLIKEGAETPLLFWQAVESLRVNTKGGKSRQAKTNGIVRRYFGATTNYGKALQCDADVIKELASMEKVTPPMLMSAQACIAKSLEEQWYQKYMKTFPDEEDLGGITLLPRFADVLGSTDTQRTVKNKTRGLWRMFTRNVISFRRGIMSRKTRETFMEFLKYEHLQAAKQAVGDGEPSVKIVIRNKVIFTERLVRDLFFWAEVEKYKDFADAVVMCARLGNYTKNDELTVVKKAYAIVDCFVDSQIPPRIQINIPNELAENIISLVKNGIIERGLFHEAALSVFSCLIHYWQRFCLFRCMPSSEIPRCPIAVRSDRSLQIAIKQRALKANKTRKVALPPDEECPKLMFSLQNGIRLAVAEIKEKTTRSSSKA